MNETHTDISHWIHSLSSSLNVSWIKDSVNFFFDCQAFSLIQLSKSFEINMIEKRLIDTQISTTEVTFQSHLINTTIFQTKSFDVLSEFALLVSCPTCSAYSAELLRESEKMSQQKERKFLFHLYFYDSIFFSTEPLLFWLCCQTGTMRLCAKILRINF